MFVTAMKCLAELIAAGADVDVQNVNKVTPLMNASCDGYADCVKLLIKAGADVNAQNIHHL